MTGKPAIGVVDYGSGNLRSVSKAFEAAGASVRVSKDPGDFEAFDALVVPGVGAFGDCAGHLREAGLWEPLKEWINAGRPFLGICLGYQLLFESSEESPGVPGLGVLPGRVVRFADSHLKIPHMGWNSVRSPRAPLFDALESASFYFVHSYYPVPGEPGAVSALCDYGGEFAAAVSAGNVHGTQFHPEKSQAAGLALLRNFLRELPHPNPNAPLSGH